LVAVGHVGETEREVGDLVDRMTWVRLGELEVLIRALREGQVTEAVMLGGIDKKRALQNFRADERALKLLQRLAVRGDDTLLGALASELEGDGIRILSSRDLMAPWLAPLGHLTSRHLTPQEHGDLELGIRVLGELGALDIGQAVVVKEGVILAVEAIEGTDQAILRGGLLGGPGAVVVKGSKPQQDMRFDVPVVGAKTLRAVGEAGARVLALEAGCTLLLDRDELVKVADDMGVCVVGWAREGSHA